MASTPVIIEGAKTLVGYEVTPPFSTSDIFTFSFPYISQDDFEITVNSETVLDPSEFEFTSDYLIQLTQTGVDNLEDLYGTLDSVPFIIRRRTQVDERLVDFRDGATLTEADLDLAVDQLFYLLQEANDSTELGRVNFNLVDGSIDFDGAELKNIGEPTGETSAVLLSTVFNNVVTPDYEENGRYRLHRLVFNDNNLYRANKDILDAPAVFNPADWDVVLTVAQLNDIGFNSQDIATNAGDIEDNAQAIQTNVNAIGSNVNAISSNANAISSNANAISGNATSINTLNTWRTQDVDPHIIASSAHNVSGNLVGTTDVQDVSNKAIIDPSRLDVKKSNEADLTDYAAGTGVYSGNGPATNGQLCFAEDKKVMYQVLDGALAKVGSGLGSAQTVFILQADDESSVSDFTGKDVLFDNGGTLDATSTLSLSTTASEFLTGKDKVFKYVAGVSGLNDFFGYERAIPQGWRGRTLAFEFTYRTNATYTDGDLVFQVKDSVGGDLLLGGAGLSLDKFESADGNGKTVRGLVNIPSDASPIRFGFQNISSTSGIEFYFDKLSFDIDDFNYQDLNGETESYILDFTTNFWDTSNGTSNFDTSLIPLTGSELLEWEDTTQTRLKAKQDIVLSVIMRMQLAGDQAVSIYRSNGQIFSNDTAKTDSTSTVSATGTIKLEAGDYIYWFRGTSVNRSGSMVITASKAAPTKHVVANSGETDVETVVANVISGYGSAGIADKIPYFSSIDIDTSDKLFSIDNSSTNGFSLTALVDIQVNGSYSIQTAPDTTLFSGWSLNSSNLTTNVALLPSSEKVAAISQSSSVPSENFTIPTTVNVVLKAGDVLRPHTSGGSFNLATNTVLNITARKKTLGEYHLVPVNDQENVFSAHILGNRSTNEYTLDYESSPFIESVEDEGAGKCKIVFKQGIFTELPTITTAVDASSRTDFDGARSADYILSSNFANDRTIRVQTKFSNGTDFFNGFGFTSYSFMITCQKTRSDYKEPKVFLGDVPVNYFQTKIDNNPANLTFNNLIVGRVYKVTLSGRIGITGSRPEGYVRALHDGVEIARIGHGNQYLSTDYGSGADVRIFTATTSTVTFASTNIQFLTNLKATLEELNHTKETTRFT